MASIGGAVLVGLALTAVPASAHPFPGFTKTSGSRGWEAKRITCGAVDGPPNRLRAHTRWGRSPANGYQRVTFTRQIRDDLTGNWATVHRQRRSTRNTNLEGTRLIIHWRQFFGAAADEADKTSRQIIGFEWMRDRRGVDRRIAHRSKILRPCVVGRR